MAFSLGLSAVPKGYMDADAQQVGTDINRLKLDEGQYAQQGAHALGRALFMAAQPGAMPMPPPIGGGPQAPPPGQGSQPSQFDQPPGQMPPPTGGGQQMPFMGGMPTAGPPQPPPQAPNPAGAPSAGPSGPTAQPAGGRPMPQFDLQTVISKIQQANPGIEPRVLLAALERASPILNQEAKIQLAQLGMQMKGENLDIREANLDRQIRQGDRRLDQGDTNIADRNARAALSRATKLEVAQLSAETKKEIATLVDAGKTGRTELSIDARKEIAGMNAAARKELVEYVQEQTNQRLDTAIAGKKDLQANAPPSATRIRQENLQRRHDQVLKTIDDALSDIGKSYQGGVSVTGAVGRGLRLGEIASNVAGWSDSTLANSFQQKIELLKTALPSLLTGRTITGKDERARMDRIVAGLSAGDTRQITVADLVYLKNYLKGVRPGEIKGSRATSEPGAAPPDDVSAKRQRAKDAGYTDEEIDAYLKGGQ